MGLIPTLNIEADVSRILAEREPESPPARLIASGLSAYPRGLPSNQRVMQILDTDTRRWSYSVYEQEGLSPMESREYEDLVAAVSDDIAAISERPCAPSLPSCSASP